MSWKSGRGLLIQESLAEILFSYISRLEPLGSSSYEVLASIAWRLYDLNKKRSVSINHSVMEILVAHHLLKKGFVVDVEKDVGGLVADVVGYRGGCVSIVEIETGFTPAEHATDPIGYLRARIVGKVARYSSKGSEFVLAFPPYYTPPIPSAFLKDPEDRFAEEIMELKAHADLYYRNPPIDIESISTARVDFIYILDVDRGRVLELSPRSFSRIADKKGLWEPVGIDAVARRNTRSSAWLE